MLNDNDYNLIIKYANDILTEKDKELFGIKIKEPEFANEAIKITTAFTSINVANDINFKQKNDIEKSNKNKRLKLIYTSFTIAAGLLLFIGLFLSYFEVIKTKKQYTQILNDTVSYYNNKYIQRGLNYDRTAEISAFELSNYFHQQAKKFLVIDSFGKSNYYFTESKNVINSLIKFEPDTAKYYIKKADILFDERKYNKAEFFYKKGISLDNKPKYYIYLAKVYAQKEDAKRAVKNIKIAFNLGFSDYSILNNIHFDKIREDKYFKNYINTLEK